MTPRMLNRALLLLIAAGALCLRGVNLAHRPMHNDEANQAYKCGQLLDSGEYAYDPVDHHGPTLYYLTLPVAWLTGRSTFTETREHTFRIVPVLFAVGVIVLLWALADGIGWGGVLVAALLTAVSPAMVFYSGFYVQEMLLVFFTLGAIGCGWRYARRHCWTWAVGFGLSIGLMHATKETCVLAYAALAGALAVLALTDGEFRRDALRSVRPGHVVVGLCCAATVSVLFFSSFFTHARGPLDSVLTYMNYLGRAGGAEHHYHPSPLYYISMLAWTRYPGGPGWSEGVILVLALVGGTVAWRSPRTAPGPDQRFVRFFSVYALLLLMIYSLIPYKTPWCMLSFLQALIVLAGVGVQFLFRRCRPVWGRAAMAIALTGAVTHLGVQARRATGRYRADSRNPYVYAHTSTDFMKLVHRIDDVQACQDDGRRLPIHVIAPAEEQWPLPFYLRHCPNVGFWPTPEGAASDAPPFVIASLQFEEAVRERLGDAYMIEFYGLRPDVLLSLWIRRDVWDRFMATRR